MCKKFKTGIVANVLEVISESYEFSAGGNEMRYCIVMDRNTGKYFITGEDGLIKYEKGYYYEALECECDRTGKCAEIKSPVNIVYIAPIFMYGKRLGYVFGEKMIDYKG